MSDLMENANERAEGIGAPAGALEKAVAFDFDKIENAVPSIVETPSKHDASLLDEYGRAGHDGKLIRLTGKHPVGRWRDLPSIGVEGGKRWMAKGGNVGFRMSDTDLVIDIDPRHFPEDDDVLGRFLRDFELPPHPFVLTGGGGQHLYFRKPTDLAIVHTLDDYPGFEFSTLGRYVVAAGSVHPDTGRLYRFDDDPLAMLLSETPKAPDKLLDALTKQNIEDHDSEPGAISEERLVEWLGHIDVTEYKDQKKWQDMMMACHFATNGAGVDEFIAWSTSDPDYAEHGDIICRRWNSLDVKPNSITARTLIAALPKEMRREATELLYRVSAEDDFPVYDEGGGEESDNVWDGWVFVAEAMQFIRREDGRKYRTDQWKALYAGLYPDGDILNAVWKSRIPIRKFERLIYLPEAPEFPYGPSRVFYNIWRKSGVEARFGDVRPFLDHMAFLFPNEGDRELVLDYLALLTQKPADKIHFALLIRGVQGTGKSWIGNLMEQIIGTPNVVRPSNDEVISKWTRWMEGAQLAIVEELMTLGRLEVANRLKPVITDPTIRIEEKNCSIYSIPNKLNFLCFTNHEDALKIEHGDRRWLVVFSPAVKKDADYYERLFGYLENGGAAFVKHWLLQRQIVLNGHGVAPATSGKETMRRMSMGDAEAFLLELYEGGDAPFDFDLVRVDDLVEAAPSALRGKANLRSRLSKFLKDELGGVAHTRHTKRHPNRPAWQLWSLRNHDIWESIGASGRIDAYINHYAIDTTR